MVASVDQVLGRDSANCSVYGVDMHTYERIAFADQGLYGEVVEYAAIEKLCALILYRLKGHRYAGCSHQGDCQFSAGEIHSLTTSDICSCHI